jgi:hypothetical protein
MEPRRCGVEEGRRRRPGFAGEARTGHVWRNLAEDVLTREPDLRIVTRHSDRTEAASGCKQTDGQTDKLRLRSQS